MAATTWSAPGHTPRRQILAAGIIGSIAPVGLVGRVAQIFYGDEGRQYLRPLRRALALLAATFGAATILVGVRVLASLDADRSAVQPLLIYNMAMGMAYLAAGVITWHSLHKGMYAAAMMLAVNLIVLACFGYLYAEGSGIAYESVRSMTVRAIVWLALFLGLAWLSRRRHSQSIWADPR